jgi:uncharacterized membrane protein YedE/YeeE
VSRTAFALFPYFVLGITFGAVLVESEVASWFRIQEMFRFEAFHMYGIIASAILVAGVSIEIIKRLGLRTADGERIGLAPKTLGRGVRYALGGAIFGIGWALTGACPGPLVALVGAGVPVMIVAVASALAGTWTYGYFRPRLPH